MAAESEHQPNFVIVDDEITKSTDEYRNSDSVNKENRLSDSEARLISKLRRKLRIFDPDGVYLFRTVKLRFSHSLCHVITLFFSAYLIVSYFWLYFDLRSGPVSGLGEVSDAQLIEQISMIGIILLTFFKLKQLVTVKVTDFDIRYKIALAANSVNRIVLDILKFQLVLLSVDTLIVLANKPYESVEVAFGSIEEGVFADTISIIIWVITFIIFYRAYKQFGKE